MEKSKNMQNTQLPQPPQKPISMVLVETKENIIKALNESNLPLFLLENIIREIHTEVAQTLQRQSIQEKQEYEQKLKEYEKALNESTTS